MGTGIVTLAFGEDFDRLAAAAFTYSRRFTALPIHVFTNMKNRSPAWDKLPDVTFQYFDLKQNENRKIKLTMNQHTPFDDTIYLDADSVVQRPGIDEFVNYYNGKSLILGYNKTFKAGKKIYNVYAQTMRKYGVKLPLRVYYGAIIAFKKTDGVDAFFKCWNKLWTTMGTAREMPALCCVVQKHKIDKADFPGGFFSGTHRVKTAVIQHDYGDSFCHKFGLPKWDEKNKNAWDSKRVKL